MSDDSIELTQADRGDLELQRSGRASVRPLAPRLEGDFAAWVGRAEGVAVASATFGLMLVLRALGIGPGAATYL